MYEKKQYDLTSVSKIKAVLLGYSSRQKYSKLKQQSKARDNIVIEIYETEKNYVTGLDHLVKYYQIPLKQAISSGNFTANNSSSSNSNSSSSSNNASNNNSNNKPLCSIEQINGVFSEVETLLGLHKVLLESLEDRLHRWTPQTKISDIFLKLVWNGIQ